MCLIVSPIYSFYKKVSFILLDCAGDSYRQALEEHTEVAQLLTHRNRQLKEVIDQMRNIIWEINTMLAMRQT